jgi:uncharacterized iron-regulated membrane protein
MSLRKAVFWLHLACGVTCGAVILVMSVTGVMLTYQKQMTEWADREYWVEPALQGRRAPLSDIVRTARAHAPGVEVSSVSLWSAPDAPVAASLSGGRTLFLDPSTAEVRGEGSRRVRAFMSWNVAMHRWFGATGEGRSTARAVTGWSNLVFLFLVLSGVFLWIPARWTRQHLRPVTLLDPAARGRARDFNWHHVFGFWTAIPLAVVVASATVISFPWASDLAYRLAGDEPPVRRQAASRVEPVGSSGQRATIALAVPGSGTLLGAKPTGAPAHELLPHSVAPAPFDVALLDALVEPATSRLPEWRTISFSIPEGAGTPVRVRIDQGWGGQPTKRHTAHFDAVTGEELSWESFGDQSPGRRLRTFLRFAHTGEYFGPAGQTLAGLASLSAVVLVWSGLALAWRRLVLRPLRRRLSGPA